MRREPSFGDLLDQQLAGAIGPGADPRVTAGFGFSTPPLFSLDPRFAFTASRLSARAAVRIVGDSHMACPADVAGRFASPHTRYQSNTHGQAAPATQTPQTPPVASRRPRRPLSVREQRALTDFIRLGAQLDADFSNAELRSAFRRLARRYHPDRHPSSSPAEKTQLANAFAQVRQAYADLQSAATN